MLEQVGADARDGAPSSSPRTTPRKLHPFVVAHRAEILARSLERIREAHPGRADDELLAPLPTTLDQLTRALAQDRGGPHVELASLGPEDRAAAGRCALERKARGFGVERVVSDYGILCDIVLAIGNEHGLTFDTRDVQVMNHTIDEGIVAALSAFFAEERSEGEQRGALVLGAFAHEVRNALQSAGMAAHLLRCGGSSGRNAEVLDRSLAQIGRLVREAFCEARLARGDAPARERVRLGDLLEHLAAAAFPQRGITISLDVEDGLEVEADPRLLESAVSNLLHNALKFTTDGQTVRLRAARSAKGWRVEVEDRCGGLPSTPHDIFEPFVSTSDERRGLGLGLTIARRAIRAHGGDLCVQDRPGVGCVFSIEVPG